MIFEALSAAAEQGERLIWCHGGNAISSALAVNAGWYYGARSDDSIARSATHGQVALLDIDWIKPDWSKHLAKARLLRPWLATVPDTMKVVDLDRTLRQAEEIAPHCSHVLIVPKGNGIIDCLPRAVGGTSIVLGYSVPTSYGGTELGLWSFRGWPVHLLGGNPRKQADLCQYLNIVSCDGNVAWRLARRGIVMTDRGIAGQTTKQMDGHSWPGDNMPLEALRRSLVNMRAFWTRRRQDIEWSEHQHDSTTLAEERTRGREDV